jgi:BlaI family transcriptional regulator, penicillinase repressor
MLTHGGSVSARRKKICLTSLLHNSSIRRGAVGLKLSRLELQILEALWAQGKASIREIQETFPEPRPAYTTIQTTVYRLEGKNAVRRVRKISNAHIFEPIVARDVTRHRLLDEILSFFGGRAQPMMAQLAEAGKLTLEDVRELEKTLKKAERKRESK